MKKKRREPLLKKNWSKTRAHMRMRVLLCSRTRPMITQLVNLTQTQRPHDRNTRIPGHPYRFRQLGIMCIDRQNRVFWGLSSLGIALLDVVGCSRMFEFKRYEVPLIPDGGNDDEENLEKNQGVVMWCLVTRTQSATLTGERRAVSNSRTTSSYVFLCITET